jgi:hypothetical protein
VRRGQPRAIQSSMKPFPRTEKAGLGNKSSIECFGKYRSGARRRSALLSGCELGFCGERPLLRGGDLRPLAVERPESGSGFPLENFLESFSNAVRFDGACSPERAFPGCRGACRCWMDTFCFRTLGRVPKRRSRKFGACTSAKRFLRNATISARIGNSRRVAQR